MLGRLYSLSGVGKCSGVNHETCGEDNSKFIWVKGLPSTKPRLTWKSVYPTWSSQVFWVPSSWRKMDTTPTPWLQTWVGGTYIGLRSMCYAMICCSNVNLQVFVQKFLINLSLFTCQFMGFGRKKCMQSSSFTSQMFWKLPATATRPTGTNPRKQIIANWYVA